MELITYQYVSTTDTLNGKVEVSKLSNEITSSDIQTALGYISLDNITLYINFKGILSETDEQLLTTIVNNHDGIYIEKITPAQVRIIEEDSSGVYKTNGKFQGKSLKIDVPSTVGIYSIITSYEHYISLLSATWFCNEINLGDKASFYIAPDTTVGYVTQNTNSGETVIRVSDTVLSNLFPGYFVKIGNNDYISVSSIDKTNKTIKIADPLTINTTVTSLVKMSVAVLHDFEFTGIGQIELGHTKIGSSIIPPNTKLKLEYNNINGTAKSFSVLIEYLY